MWKVVLVIFIVSLVSFPAVAGTLQEELAPFIVAYGEPEYTVVIYCRDLGWRARQYYWKKFRVVILWNRSLFKGWRVVEVQPLFNA